jgi:hypothetical protein
MVLARVGFFIFAAGKIKAGSHSVILVAFF